MSKRAFRKYFEWIDDTIYIRSKGALRDTHELGDLLGWWVENWHELNTIVEDNKNLRAELHALWAKHSRLLDHLGLEDVTMPSEQIIRKKKP